jgi:Gene product 88
MAHTTPKRNQPSADVLAWRKNYLLQMRELRPLEPEANQVPALEPGNSKTGTSGKFYGQVLIWNLPAVSTCPGASPACLSMCYNADTRQEVFPIDRWRSNLWWVLNRPEALRDQFLKQLSEVSSPAAVRIHSSGDFFSLAYIEFWTAVIRTAPHISFWAYTRSWTSTALRPALETLRSLPNLQLFASWDSSMIPPPMGWRVSYVQDEEAPFPPPALLTHPVTRPQLFYCPEQNGQVPNCASCGFCMRPDSRGVLFDLH